MSRARPRMTDWQATRLQNQTAAAGQTQGSGCLSGFVLPPLAVLLISAALALMALRGPAPASAVAAYTGTPIPSQPVEQPMQPAAVITDGSGQAVSDPVSLSPEVAQVYDGTGQPAVPSAMPPEVAQLYAVPVPQVSAVIVDTPPEVAQVFAPAKVSGLAPFFRPEVLYWGEALVRWSAQAGVDPNLAATVMQIESCGDPQALSRSGAIGLFQVMPFHFRAGDNPYDPDTNALRGLNYLARSMNAAGGNARLALAGYNGGIGVISRGEWTWAAETARYVYFGAPIYEDAVNGRAQSNALEEWYTKYGVSLCRRAGQNQE